MSPLAVYGVMPALADPDVPYVDGVAARHVIPVMLVMPVTAPWRVALVGMVTPPTTPSRSCLCYFPWHKRAFAAWPLKASQAALFANAMA